MNTMLDGNTAALDRYEADQDRFERFCESHEPAAREYLRTTIPNANDAEYVAGLADSFCDHSNEEWRAIIGELVRGDTNEAGRLLAEWKTIHDSRCVDERLADELSRRWREGGF